MILPHPNNGTTSFFTLLHQSPFPLRTNVAPKLLEAPPQSQSSGFRVSDAIVLARRREEVRGIVGERWLREIGSWQLGFAMETRCLPRVPQQNPKCHCLWRCSHPLLNRFTFLLYFSIFSILWFSFNLCLERGKKSGEWKKKFEIFNWKESGTKENFEFLVSFFLSTFSSTVIHVFFLFIYSFN